MDKPNKFLDNLTSYGLGYLVDELSDKQEKIIEAVRRTGKPGALTIKLSYKRNGLQQIDIAPTVTPKIPVDPIKQVTMFADEKNQLHEDNPDQLTFENVTKIDDHKKKVNALD